MWRVVALQFAVLTLLSLVFGVVLNIQAAYSVILGGVSYIVPTICAILVLNVLSSYSTLAGMGFIVSECLKIVLALILMTATISLYHEIRFFPYFVGLLSVSHFVFLFYLKVHRYGK